MALSTAAKNSMLSTIAEQLDHLYLMKNNAVIDNAISGYSAYYAGYTSSGARYVAMSWGSASGGSIVSSNSASSSPIMWAVPTGTTLTQLAYVDSATGNVVATYSASGSYTSSDGSYYISNETFSFI